MIDNLELISPLLNFENEGDFYMLYVFKRKKDQVDKDNHQSVRTIKTYCVNNLKYLHDKYPEITTLCEIFKARAYIHIQRQNHLDVSLSMMIELANRIKNNVHNQKGLFDSVVGKLNTYVKRWIVDIDTKDTNTLISYRKLIERTEPLDKQKIILELPTKSGFHFITHPFNVQTFTNSVLQCNLQLPDIQKRNPTLLYLPKTLSNE